MTGAPRSAAGLCPSKPKSDAVATINVAGTRLGCLRSVISGGQTGVARAALDWAIGSGIKHGGWCRVGRKAEDGIIPPTYQLKEIDTNRTGSDIRANVLHSDATLILNVGALDGWTYRTVGVCERAKKPFLVVQLDDDAQASVTATRSWLLSRSVAVLCVAGPRESKRPGIATAAAKFLRVLGESP